MSLNWLKSLVLVLCFSWFLLRANGQTAASVASSNYSPTVIIDPNRIADSDLSYVVVALSRAKLSTWRTAQVHSSLFDTVSREFSFADGGPFPKTATALAKEVAEVNGISDPSKLKEGAPILVPPLPARPNSIGADSEWTQTLDVSATHSTMMSVENATEWKLEPKRQKPETHKPSPRRAATWWIALSDEQASSFRREVPETVLRNLLKKRLIYVGPTAEMVSVKPRETTCEPDFAVSSGIPSPTQTLLSNIGSGSAGNLVILDRFHPGPNGGCTHGLIVESVAKQILQSEAPQLVSNILRAEVDFFADVSAASKTMDSYISTFPADNVRAALQQNAEALKKLQKDPNNPFVVPLFYVQALLWVYLDKHDTQVISSSVWFQKDGYELLPRNFDYDGTAMLTAAVSDDHVPVEEAAEEPISSFYNRKDFRTLLVGAYGNDGHPFGGYSKVGRGVCCIAPGEGWTSTSQCSVRGTSFATPEIATYLFLARAYWRNSGVLVSPQEAYLRLILSSQVRPDWVGQGYAAAGPPQLPLLLTTSKKYVVRHDLSIVPIEVDAAKTHILLREEGARFKHEVALSCGGDDGLCGLKVVNGTAFVFRQTKGAWEKADEVDLDLEFSDGSSVNSIANFATLYEGAYSL